MANDIWHIAMMRNKKNEWVDVYYNKDSTEVYQAYNPKYPESVLGMAQNKQEAEQMLEREYDGVIELD